VSSRLRLRATPRADYEITFTEKMQNNSTAGLFVESARATPERYLPIVLFQLCRLTTPRVLSLMPPHTARRASRLASPADADAPPLYAMPDAATTEPNTPSL